MSEENCSRDIRKAAQDTRGEIHSDVVKTLNGLAENCLICGAQKVIEDGKSVDLIFASALSDDPDEQRASANLLILLIGEGYSDALKKHASYIAAAENLAVSTSHERVSFVGQDMLAALRAEKIKTPQKKPSL